MPALPGLITAGAVLNNTGTGRKIKNKAKEVIQKAGITGKQGQTNPVPQDIQGLRTALSSWLQSGGIPNFQQQNSAYSGNGSLGGSGAQFGPSGGSGGYLTPDTKPQFDISQLFGGGATGGPNIQSASLGGGNPALTQQLAGMGPLSSVGPGGIPSPNPTPISGNYGSSGPQGFERIFAPNAVQAPGVTLAGVDQFQGAQLDPASLAQGAMIDRTGLGVNDILGALRGVGGAGAGQVGNTPLAQSSIGLSQSVDQLGGANSEFFKNMLAQLQPAFAQQRGLGLAAAKEASGNLTGSGYAANLGNVVNRSLGDEQARLADYASQGLQTEVGRQLGLVNAENTRNISNADLQAQNARMNAQLATQASIANAGQGSQNLLGGLGILAQLAQGQAGLDQQANLFNAGAQNTRSLQQGDFNQRALELYQNLLGNRNLQQGQLDQQRNIYNATSQNAIGQGNANNFLQLLLGMSTQGVGTPQPTYKPGLTDYLGQALGALPLLLK